MTIWDCRTHVPMTSMTSSVERTDLDFKISVALVTGDIRMSDFDQKCFSAPYLNFDQKCLSAPYLMNQLMDSDQTSSVV